MMHAFTGEHAVVTLLNSGAETFKASRSSDEHHLAHSRRKGSSPRVLGGSTPIRCRGFLRRRA